MALKYFTDISLEQNELLEASLQKVTQDPLGFVGQIIYNTAEQTFKYYNGSAWKEITGDYPTLTDFAQEVQDRINGDAGLQGEIDTLSGTTAQLVLDLANEIQNRINGDNALQSNIDDVVNDLNDEIQNRVDADSLLQDGVDANAQAIVDEYDARVLNDNILQGNIDSEETARIDGDAALQAQIDAISENDTLDTVTTRGNTTTNDITVGSVSVTSGTATQFLKADGTTDNTQYSTALELAAEAAIRGTNDGTLQDNIDAEALERSNADGTLQDNIDAETLARTNADNTLQDNIDAEETARIAGDDALQQQIDGIGGDLSDYQLLSEKGQADGYASLDSNGTVPVSQLPESVTGALEFKGVWDASTNTPPLPDPTTHKGEYYKVSVEGTYLGTLYHVGDWALSDGVAWEHIHTQETVSDVFGREGSIVAVESDYSAFYPLIQDLTDETNARIAADAALQLQIDDISENDTLDTVTGRGNVTSNSIQVGGVEVNGDVDIDGDINIDGSDLTTNSSTFNLLSVNASTINAFNQASTINMGLGTGTLNLSNMSITAYRLDLGGTYNAIINMYDAQSRSIFTASALGTTIGSTDINKNLSIYGNIVATGDAYAASFVKDGGTAAQFLKADGSIDSTEYIPVGGAPAPNDATITLTAGGGLTGGGDFTTDQSLNETITVSHADTSSQGDVTNTGLDFIQSVTLDGYGHVTGLTSATVTIPSVNDATITLSAGTGLTGGGDFTTDQATNETLTITHADTTRTNTTSSSTLSHESTFTAITSVTTNSLGHVTGANTETYTLPSGAVPNDAVITLAAGTGLTGGGDFTTDQSGDETITFNATDVYDRFQAIASAGQTTIYADGTADTLTINGGSQIDVTTDASTDTLTIGHGNTSGLNGTYGSTSNSVKIDTITVDGNGHITAITTGGTGDIDGVSAGTGLSGGGTSGSVTLSHGDTSTLDGTYGGYSPVIERKLYIDSVTVDEFGHLTNVTTTIPEIFSFGDGISVAPQPPVGYDFAIGLDYAAMSNFINSPSNSLTIQPTLTNSLEIDLNAPNGVNTFYWMGGTNGQHLVGNGYGGIIVDNQPPAGYDFSIGLNPQDLAASFFSINGDISIGALGAGINFDLNAPNGVNTFYWMGGQNGQYLIAFSPRDTITTYAVPMAPLDLMFDVNPFLRVVRLDFDVMEGMARSEDHLKFTSNLTGQYEFYGVDHNFFINTFNEASLSFPSTGGRIDYYAEIIPSVAGNPPSYGMQFQSNTSGQYKFFCPNGVGGSSANLFVNTNSSFIESDGYQIGFRKSDASDNPYQPLTIILGASTGPGPSDTGYIYADGALLVFSNLDVYGTKNFRIDHPVSPNTHDLVHTVIESNRGDVLYRGKTKLVNGSASINIDSEVGMMTGTFEALTKDVQVFTTNEDGWTQVKGSVTGSTLNIIAQDTNCTDEVSWLIMGERNDKAYVESTSTDENGYLIIEPEETRTLEDKTNEIRKKS